MSAPVSTLSQELNCNVIVNGDATTITDPSIFRDMENGLEQFLNNKAWTENTYENFERIKCNILITLDQQSTLNNYQGSVQIQSARPVYNSTYESILFNFADRDWVFNYVVGQPLEFNENAFLNNLSSILAFYAYIIIGLDNDSFEEMGGTPHFQQALNIVNNAQQSNRPGWDPLNSSRNRYWLMENINNQQMQDVRKAWYAYHRTGLDMFFEKPEECRDAALRLLEAMQKSQKVYPNSILVISILDAKSNEFVNVFQEADLNQRKKAYDFLINLDPTRKQKYDGLIQ